MTNIYFDTEFTSLRANAAPISIGLICENSDNSFYAQFSDTYKFSDCSEFCQNEVLPLLDPHLNFPQAELKKNLAAWLSSQGSVLLLSDSKNDVNQFYQLFPAGLPNVQCKKMGFLFNLKRRFYKNHYYKTKGLRYHHSLDDAIVNKLVAQTSFI